MGYTAEDFDSMLRRIQYNLTTLKAQVSELAGELAQIPLPTDSKPHECPSCGLGFRTEAQLIDHRRNVHWEPLRMPEEAEDLPTELGEINERLATAWEREEAKRVTDQGSG